ncbi:MAG TPA: sulfotransferase [Kiritimatiellia bacterium]|nr:sulfotransferase [Kiritimatiellia bacterium]
MWQRFKTKLTTEWFIELNHDPRRAIALAGCERSGTTWVANLINHSRDFRLLFEPLRPDMAYTKGLNHRVYIRPGDPAPEMRALMDRIFSGRVRDPHLDHLNERWLCTRRLAKFVRANLLLKWMIATFPFVPAVFLVRHPFAVASSRLRKGWNWFPSMKGFLFQQPALREDLLDRHVDRFERAEGALVQQVLIWCVEHAIPFRHLAPDDVHTVFYEDLVLRPRETIPALLQSIGVPEDDRVFSVSEIRSATSNRDTVRLVDADFLMREMNITRSEIDAALETLHAFGLDHVYGPGSEPMTRQPFGLS